MGGNVNDLWSFDVSTGMWTWIGGSSTINQAIVYTGANAAPGAILGAAMWGTKTGQLYLFGGYGFIQPNVAGKYVADVISL